MQQHYYENVYARTWKGTVTALTEAGHICLDSTIFYATGGGQPCDIGNISYNGNDYGVIDVSKGPDGKSYLELEPGSKLPQIGSNVSQTINWKRRYKFMRMHTALHLLSVVIPLPVTGGSISEHKGRLDFNMPEMVDDKSTIEHKLNELITMSLTVSQEWISDNELNDKPELVKTMSVKPPMGRGIVRLVRIGSNENMIDLQPCGGTHVANTSEIGHVTIGKIEKKGRLNRRINIHLQ